MTQASGKLFERAQQVIPGGVNSPVRAFKAVGGSPVFMARGKGPYLYDSEGKSYIDYVGSWGPMILGHADPDVVLAVQTTVENGLSFGAPTVAETEMAELICEAMPSIEQVRMVNSGTEATMSAIRLARGFTGRDKVIKFEGCYHGHADGLLVKAGSGALTLGVPTSPGVPVAMAQHTLTLEFNNAQQSEDVFSRMGPEIAAVIVEPVAGNMNCVPGSAVFHQALRDQCNKYGAVLIFDEVMTGFRVAPGGAQALYGIVPDLTTLGKVIGGGLPVGRELRSRHQHRYVEFRNARRQYRPVLLHADGGAEPQCPPQAGDGDAPHRRADRRRYRQGVRPRQPYCSEGISQPGGAEICRSDRFEIAADAEDRQGSVLPSGGDEPVGRL